MYPHPMVIGRVWDRVPYTYITGIGAVAPLDRCDGLSITYTLYIKVLIDNDHMVLSGPHRSCASSYLGSWSRVVGYSITLPPWNLGPWIG